MPQPVHFADGPGLAKTLGLTEAAVEANLDWLVEKLRDDGAVYPVWSWGDDDLWAGVRLEWAGCLTLQALRVLRAYGRLEPGPGETR